MTINLTNPVTIPKTNAPSSDADYLKFKPWTKNGVTRIYINDYKRRTIGYINEDGSSVISDNQGNTTELTEEIHAFWTAHDADKKITIYADGIYIKWGALK